MCGCVSHADTSTEQKTCRRSSFHHCVIVSNRLLMFYSSRKWFKWLLGTLGEYSHTQLPRALISLQEFLSVALMQRHTHWWMTQQQRKYRLAWQQDLIYTMLRKQTIISPSIYCVWPACFLSQTHLASAAARMASNEDLQLYSAIVIIAQLEEDLTISYWDSLVSIRKRNHHKDGTGVR